MIKILIKIYFQKAIFSFFLFLIFWIPAQAIELVADVPHSSIEFSVNHLGLIPVKGRFKKFSFSGTLDEKTLSVKNIVVKVDVDSIDTENKDRDDHLRSKDFFHVRNELYDIVDKNRYITFRLSQFNAKQRRGKVKGKLKILGKERPVSIDSKVKILKNEKKFVRGSLMGTTKIDRTKFGLTWQKAQTGAFAKAAGKFVGDEVSISVNLLLKPKKKN